jgi:hypothetical protein
MHNEIPRSSRFDGSHISPSLMGGYELESNRQNQSSTLTHNGDGILGDLGVKHREILLIQYTEK